MSYIQDQEWGYRRGLVLGLTMAEIVILVIFVLLLLFSLLHDNQVREADDLRSRIVVLKTNAAAMDKLVGHVGKDLEVIIHELEQASENQNRLMVLEDETKQLKNQIKEMESSRPTDMVEQSLPEVFREIVLLRNTVMSAGILPTPAALQNVLEEAAVMKEVVTDLAGRDVVDLIEQNTRLVRDNENLSAQMENIRRQVQSAGQGLDHPPCWATPDGKAEYIFDIALTSQGLILRDRELAHRTSDRIELPLTGLSFETDLPADSFLAMTEPLFQWSVDHECRFVVRVFDTTGPSEKGSYKQHMRVLEQRFYKFEETRETF